MENKQMDEDGAQSPDQDIVDDSPDKGEGLDSGEDSQQDDGNDGQEAMEERADDIDGGQQNIGDQMQHQHQLQQQQMQQMQWQQQSDAEQDYEQMDFKICGELVERNKALDEYAMSQDTNGVIQVRIQQLALCKLLVNIHKKDLFLLVTAYAKLGDAYLKNRYFEQALDHLTTALKLNGSLFTKIEVTKQYHSHILTLLGNCYMEAGNYKDALSLLEKSLKMNKQILGETHSSNAQIYSVIGQVYTRQKDYERALNVLADAWELFEMNFGKGSEQVGNCFIEIAGIHYKKKEYEEAITFQSKALDVFSELEKFSNTEFLAQISIQLAEIQEKAEQFDSALQSQLQAKHILEDNYSLVDKRTCKVKRNISLLYLKSNKYDEALQELKEVEELEQTLYGDRSLNVGKTYKVIGTILIIQNQIAEAKEYLQRAYHIFELKGNQKFLKEVKHKLKLLSQSNRQAAAMAAAEIAEGSEYDSNGEQNAAQFQQRQQMLALQNREQQPQISQLPHQQQSSAGAKKKTKKPAVKKRAAPSGGPKTNNFFD